MLGYLKYLNIIFSLSLTVIYPVFARLYLLNCLSTVYLIDIRVNMPIVIDVCCSKHNNRGRYRSCLDCQVLL